MAGEPTLREGNSGEWVLYLQDRLAHHGFGSGQPGFYDDGTKWAVWALQGDIGLEQDGVTGPDTWRFLVDGVRPGRQPTQPSPYGGLAGNVDFVGDVTAVADGVRFFFVNQTDVAIPGRTLANFVIYEDADGNTVHDQVLEDGDFPAGEVRTCGRVFPRELAPGRYRVHVVLDSGNGAARTIEAVVSGDPKAFIWSELVVEPDYNPQEGSIWYQARNAGPRTAAVNEVGDVVEVPSLGYRRVLPNGVELAPGEHYTAVAHGVSDGTGLLEGGTYHGTLTLHGGTVHHFTFMI